MSPASTTAGTAVPRLATRGLTCMRGDRRLIKGLDLAVGDGTLLHVRGANGRGKTTLLRALCGLFEPQEGAVLWDGADIRELREDFFREVIYLGHLNGIKHELNALENLTVSAVLDGDQVEASAVLAALDRMGLAGYEDLPAKVLSQGQKKRVALARLLLTRARLWVLDEPFTALDVRAVDQLQQVIADHVARGGIAVLTTHQEVALTAGRIERLELGG